MYRRLLVCEGLRVSALSDSQRPFSHYLRGLTAHGTFLFLKCYKPLALILLAILLNLFLPLARASATQISFVPSPPPSKPQGQPGQQGQQGQQGQKGLSPDKKKSLSKYGPEDVFPGAREQDNNKRQSRGQSQRQSTPTAQPSPTMPPAQIPTVTPTLLPTVAVLTPTPAPTTAPMTVAMARQQPPSQNGKPSSSILVPVALSAASLLVLGALIYVVRMLKQRLRESR